MSSILGAKSPTAILSITFPANKSIFCGTTLTNSLKLSCWIYFKSKCPIVILPFCMENKFCSKEIKVDFPEPLSPTIAVIFPFLIFKLKSVKTSTRVPYLKATFLNSI